MIYSDKMLQIDNIICSLLLLKNFCEKEHFKGWDPYDGLNSKVFQAIPFLKKSALCRLVMIQGFKRCPINLRKLAVVPKDYNAKGIGLFLSGYCTLFQVVQKYPEWMDKLGSQNDIKRRIHELAELLIQLQSKGFSGQLYANSGGHEHLRYGLDGGIRDNERPEVSGCRFICRRFYNEGFASHAVS